jgi:hypothetical protein
MLVFICDLYNDAVSCSAHIASNGRRINEEVTVKNVEGAERASFEVLSQHLSGGDGKLAKNLRILGVLTRSM